METKHTGTYADPAKLKEFVHAKIAENESIMPRDMALETGEPMQRIICALPENMRVQAPKEDFEAIWKAMVQWEKATFMAETSGMIIEVSCKLAEGKHGHGMYNLMDKSSPLNGHILISQITEIWLVSKPLFGLESHSVQFFTKNGDNCFSVYLGRNEKRELIPSVKESYMQLWNTYSA